VGLNYTRFVEDIDQSSALPDFFTISYIFLCFETRANQMKTGVENRDQILDF